ncbi:MAG: citrate/2-methylcitrate synthase [Dongiaceae bacterium]
MAAGIASLWGPAHGGANEAVLAYVAADWQGATASRYISAKSTTTISASSGASATGFTRIIDPRAAGCARVVTMCSMLPARKRRTSRCWSYRNSNGLRWKMTILSRHKLFPNVDFIRIILQAISSRPPCSRFCSRWLRTVGWVAQWKEMIEDPTQRIGRPRQLYTGYGERPYLPIEKRK